MTGIWLFRAIAGSASASSWLGQATRTMSQPEAVSSAICWSVALMSVVGVVVIDCTEIGESLPTPTLPTWIWRVWRRRGEDRRGQGRHTEGDAHAVIMSRPRRRGSLRRARGSGSAEELIGLTMSA